MRGHGDIWPSQAHSTPTTPTNCGDHKALLSAGQKTQPRLSPQDYKQGTQKEGLRDRCLALQTSGEESESHRMVAKAVARGVLQGPFCMLAFLFCSETRFPSVAQASQELTMSIRSASNLRSSSCHCLPRAGTEADTSINGVSMQTGLKRSSCPMSPRQGPGARRHSLQWLRKSASLRGTSAHRT